MASSVSHPWAVSPQEARAIQRRLAPLVQETSLATIPKRIGGIDVGISGHTARSAVVILTYPDLQPVERVSAEQAVTFPYVPGLLSFREVPVILSALRQLSATPDLLLCDAQGRAHPRRLGLASHLGILTDLPTIGCAKSRLTGKYEEPGHDPGAWSPLIDKDEVIGAVLRTRKGVSPVYVSVGHRVDLAGAIAIVIACCRGCRLPEPTRLAHLAAGGA
ncbi:MAG: deoxyribonuclease V [Anaerolineae bacterium]|nr:deoxyribonuclease V [Anaerolineae bacterium]